MKFLSVLPALILVGGCAYPPRLSVKEKATLVTVARQKVADWPNSLSDEVRDTIRLTEPGSVGYYIIAGRYGEYRLIWHSDTEEIVVRLTGELPGAMRLDGVDVR